MAGRKTKGSEPRVVGVGMDVAEQMRQRGWVE